MINCDMQINKFFGTSGSLLNSMETLVRRATLHNRFPEEPNERLEQQVTKLCQEMLKQQPVAAKEKMFDGLEEISYTLVDFYSPLLKSDVDLPKLIRRVQKDVNALMLCPVRKAKGLKGPTLLVNQLKFKNDSPRIDSCVIKWTKWNEIAWNRIYGFFSQNLKKPKEFQVPKSAALDFKQHIHEAAEGKRVGLDSKIEKSLRAAFSNLKQLYSQEESKRQEIMISEKIVGENLFEFAYTKYLLLNEDQKQQVFKKLGKVAVLDILLGNPDRLARFSFDERERAFQLDEDESNLGNIMIEFDLESENDPHVYLIDNGAKQKLFNDSDKRQAYLNFLKEIFCEGDPVEILTDSVFGSLRTAMNTMPDDVDEDENPGEIRKKLKTFLNDRGLREASFQEGVQAMIEEVRTLLLPAWNSDCADSLKSYLSQINPNLVPVITERLGALQKNNRSLLKALANI